MRHVRCFSHGQSATLGNSSSTNSFTSQSYSTQVIHLDPLLFVLFVNESHISSSNMFVFFSMHVDATFLKVRHRKCLWPFFNWRSWKNLAKWPLTVIRSALKLCQEICRSIALFPPIFRVSIVFDKLSIGLLKTWYFNYGNIIYHGLWDTFCHGRGKNEFGSTYVHILSPCG